MNKIGIGLLLGLFALANAANAQQSMRIRGTITGVDGNVLSVKSRDGKDLKINLAENVGVATTKAITLKDLKPGDYVGTTAMKGADGRLVAVEVHTIPKVAPEGHGPWDLQPGSTMTNAYVASTVQASGGEELTLQYKGGSQKILVPSGTPIVTNVPADRSALKKGEWVFLIAQVAPDGKMTAARVTVSKDGIKPPQ